MVFSGFVGIIFNLVTSPREMRLLDSLHMLFTSYWSLWG